MEESLGCDEEDTGEHHVNEEYLGAAQDYKTPKLDRESEGQLILKQATLNSLFISAILNIYIYILI